MDARGSRRRGAEGEIGRSAVEVCLRSDGIRLPPTEKGKLIEGVLGGGRVDRKGKCVFFLPSVSSRFLAESEECEM